MKKYLCIIIGVIIFLPGITVPSFYGGIEHLESDHEHGETDGLKSSYIPCWCGHGTCTGRVETCPCCGFGAPPPPPPPPPPDRITYVPDICTVTSGIIRSGDPYQSPRYDDNNNLVVQLQWFGIPFIYGGYSATIRAYFDSHPRVIEVYLDLGIYDLFRWYGMDIYVSIYFMDGSFLATVTPASIFDFPWNIIFDPHYINNIKITFVYENPLFWLDVRAWIDCINVIY